MASMTLVVYPLVRPKIDNDKFTRALLELAREQPREDDVDDSSVSGR